MGLRHGSESSVADMDAAAERPVVEHKTKEDSPPAGCSGERQADTLTAQAGSAEEIAPAVEEVCVPATKVTAAPPET